MKNKDFVKKVVKQFKETKEAGGWFIVLGLAVLTFLIIVLILAVLPFLFIWSWNALFKTGIEFTVKTAVAFYAFFICLKISLKSWF